MALDDYRVIDYPEKTSVDNTDFMMIDSESNGTNKYQIQRIITEAEAKVAAAVAAEAEAREAADDALQDDIDTRATSADLAAEATAREQADADLKADLTTEQTARENADTALQTAVNSKADSTALTAEQTARQNADNALGEDITALSEDVETNYAKIDGYYDSLGVGMADQLASNKYTEDNEPYVYRTSGGSADIGDREYDEIVGGTVAWNQLFNLSNRSRTINGITVTQSEGVKVSYVGTMEDNDYIDAFSYTSGDAFLNNFVVGHKYLITAKSTDNRLYLTVNKPYIDLSQKTSRAAIYSPTTTPTYFLGRVLAKSGEEVNGSGYIQCIDLTTMFGASVADAIYALEQAEAGVGAAWFKKLFPKDYYPYNAGELISVSALQSHDMVGFNQLPKSPEYISNYSALDKSKAVRVIAGKEYEFSFDGIGSATNWRIFFKYWDLDGNMLGNSVSPSERPFTVTNGFPTWNTNYNGWLDGSNSGVKSRIYIFDYDGYVTFQFWGGDTTSSMEMTNACLHFVGSGWRNGEYEPYDKHSYPLDSSLTLRGIPKVDSAGNLYYDGDTYSHDGTVTRRYGVVDLGTLTWTLSADGYYILQTAIPGIKPPANESTKANAIAENYLVVTSNGVSGGTEQGIGIRPNGYAYASDTGSTPSGYLVYELATPTTETATPYASPQIVDDFGTEEYVSTADIPIPVGHNTKYMANLRDKLVHLPNLADSDGAYLIQQTGHTMELVKFRVPKAPTTDGTYTLKATVSGGTPTYTWEVVE